MLLLETNLTRFTEADLQTMLDALPPTWQARVLRKKPLKSRLQSAIGYTLLRKILQDEYGITNLPAIFTDKCGKPHFEESDLYFSISHCHAAVACIVETHPVAVDVQDILTDISPALAARIAAPLDANGLTADGRRPQDLTPKELTALWTQKESSAKLDGRGLQLGLENLPIKGHKVETIRFEGFVLTTARYM